MDCMRIDLPGRKKSEILALGAQSKSSFCFVKQRVAYLSEPDGDLGDLENFKVFERRIKGLKRKLKIDPGIIACDLHPEYMSTKYANDLVKDKVFPRRSLSRAKSRDSGQVKAKAIQHHQAHVASCIVDNKVKGNVIGVAFDGTGFGLDGNIWGGEFFAGTIRGFKRVAHLQYIPMPGGEASVREPWHMALSYLYNIYGAKFKDLKLNFLTRLDKGAIELLIQVINKRINSPLTSSVGRLFDAVSSILDICDVAEYEGQAAIELEKAISNHESSLDFARDKRIISRLRSGQANHDRYSFNYRDKNGVIEIDWTPVIKGVVEDLQVKKSKSEISIKFHNAICHMIKEVCNLLRKKYKIGKVCLSGGVFQNKYLTDHIRPLLEKQGFQVYLHKNIPTHDGSIALGQAAIAGY